MLEHDPLTCQRIKVWSEPAIRPQESHAIRTGRINGYENDIGSLSVRKASRRANYEEDKRPEKPHKQREFTKGKLPEQNQKKTPSEINLQAELHVTLRAGTEDRV